MTQANRVTFASIAACVFGLAGTTQPAEPARRTFDKNSPYYFDGTISRQTLEHYLDRAITMGYFLVPGQPEGYQFPSRDDDVRMIHNLGIGESGTGRYRENQPGATTEGLEELFFHLPKVPPKADLSRFWLSNFVGFLSRFWLSNFASHWSP